MTPRWNLGVVFCLGLMAAVAFAAPSLMFDGKIVSVDQDKLVLSAGAEQPAFELSKATKITLNGKPATITELMAGQTAKVVAQREDDKLRAVAINAFSPK
jgi:hypothetical protein